MKWWLVVIDNDWDGGGGITSFESEAELLQEVSRVKEYNAALEARKQPPQQFYVIAGTIQETNDEDL